MEWPRPAAGLTRAPGREPRTRSRDPPRPAARGRWHRATAAGFPPRSCRVPVGRQFVLHPDRESCSCPFADSRTRSHFAASGHILVKIGTRSGLSSISPTPTLNAVPPPSRRNRSRNNDWKTADAQPGLRHGDADPRFRNRSRRQGDRRWAERGSRELPRPGADRWRRGMGLGHQRQRPDRRRHNDGARDANRDHRVVGSPRHRRRDFVELCVEKRRDGVGVGIQRVWPARRRDDDAAPRARPGLGTEWHRGDRGRRLSRGRTWQRRDRLDLGTEPLRAARRRDDHAAFHSGAGDIVGDDGCGDRRCREQIPRGEGRRNGLGVGLQPVPAKLGTARPRALERSPSRPAR